MSWRGGVKSNKTEMFSLCSGFAKFGTRDVLTLPPSFFQNQSFSIVFCVELITASFSFGSIRFFISSSKFYLYFFNAEFYVFIHKGLISVPRKNLKFIYQILF